MLLRLESSVELEGRRPGVRIVLVEISRRIPPLFGRSAGEPVEDTEGRRGCFRGVVTFNAMIERSLRMEFVEPTLFLSCLLWLACGGCPRRFSSHGERLLSDAK